MVYGSYARFNMKFILIFLIVLPAMAYAEKSSNVKFFKKLVQNYSESYDIIGEYKFDRGSKPM